MKILLLFVCGSLITLPQFSFGQDDARTDTLPSQSRVFFELGYTPMASIHSWGPRYSVRLAYYPAAFTVGPVDLAVNFIYIEFGLDDEFSTGAQQINNWQSVRRRDIGVYLSGRFSFVELGLGVVYLRSDEVAFYSGDQFIMRWPYGALAKFTYYASVGLAREVPIDGDFFLPIGIHYVLPTEHAVNVPFELRAGIGRRF